MKRFHSSLRLGFATAALTTALLENQVLPLLATEVVPLKPAPTSVDRQDTTPVEANVAPTAPEATTPVTAAPAPEPPPAPAPAPEPSPAQAAPARPASAQSSPRPSAQPSPAATATHRSTPDQAARLAATRQQMEERLAAIVARDQAAKTAQLQQNLIASALHYAEAGDFVQARRTAQHPALSPEVQADTLAKIDTIAAAVPGIAPSAAPSIRPSIAVVPPVSRSATVAQPTPQLYRTAVSRNSRGSILLARSPQIQRANGSFAIGNRCLPRPANRVPLTVPTAVSAPVVSPAPPIKSMETMGSLKPMLAKAPASIRPEAEVSLERSASPEAGGRAVSSDRVAATIQVIPNAAAAPIALKLTNLVASIRAVSLAPLIPTTAATPPQPALQPESSLVGPTIALAIAKQTKGPEAMPLPSLPIVYVDAKVDSSQNAAQTIPAIAPCTDTNASLTVSYPVRTGLTQRLDQLGFSFPLPIPASITSAFGWRIHPITGDRRFHAGVDFGAPMGTPVMAALPGQVVAAGDRGGYGLAVIIENNAQRNLYAHLSGIAVQPGQTVPAGSVIGWVGSTGNSTGPHLHFESQYLTPSGWQAVDPLTNGAIARGF